jgi:hypothetical protein
MYIYIYPSLSLSLSLSITIYTIIIYKRVFNDSSRIPTNPRVTETLQLDISTSSKIQSNHHILKYPKKMVLLKSSRNHHENVGSVAKARIAPIANFFLELLQRPRLCGQVLRNLLQDFGG